MIANTALKSSTEEGTADNLTETIMDGSDGITEIDLEKAVHDHYKRVYRFALHLTRHQEDAEDLTQHAYEKLAARHTEVRDPSKVRSWLQSIVYRKFLDQKRRVIRFPHVQYNEEQDVPAGGTADRGLRIDARTAIEKLHLLDDDLRAPLILFYLESNTYREIAGILNLPVGTVMSRLYRGKATLYNLLQGKQS